MSILWLMQAAVQFAGSLWKVYVGAILAVPFGFSYMQMLLVNMPAVFCSALVAMKISDYLQRRHQRPSKGYNRYLRMSVKMWRRYGKNGAALLAPVLLGIPVYAFIGRRLRMSEFEVIWRLLVSSFFWCTICYWAALQGILLVDDLGILPSFLQP